MEFHPWDSRMVELATNAVAPMCGPSKHMRDQCWGTDDMRTMAAVLFNACWTGADNDATWFLTESSPDELWIGSGGERTSGAGDRGVPGNRAGDRGGVREPRRPGGGPPS